MSLRRFLSSRSFGRKVKAREVFIESPDQIPQWLYWGSKDAGLRFYLPAGILCMHGCFNYASGYHPMVRALEGGPDVLTRFYEAHQPENVAQSHWVDDRVCDVPPMELPWIGKEERKVYRGEKGLGAEHGISYFGPCSADKVDLEYRRLHRLARSIRELGYDPDTHGDIQGMFLRNDGDFRFFVRGGKHRAAVLAALDCQQIPVAFKPSWPRVVDIADFNFWPMVREERIDADLARDLFLNYFRLDGRQQFEWLGLGTLP